MTDPEVTVVVPTRDRMHLLALTVSHVLAQRDVDLELIVVDDGSTDGTSAWVQALDDPRVSLVVGQGHGVASARNLGLAQAKAPLVAFNDDDDLWAPDKLRTQVGQLRARPGARWSCSGAVQVNDDLQVISAERIRVEGDVSTVGLVGNPVPGGASGVVAETELVRQVGGFDERFHVLADWDLWVRLGCESKMGAVDRPLHAYRLHAGGMSGAVSATRPEIGLFERKYAVEREERGVALNMPRLEYWMADRAQRSGDRRGAAMAFLRAAEITGPRSVTRAAEALLWPSGYRARDRRGSRHVEADWLAEVATWLPAPERTAVPAAHRATEVTGRRRRRPPRAGHGQ